MIPALSTKHVQRPARGDEARGKRVDRGGIEEIEPVDLDVREPGQRRARRFQGPGADHHRRAGLRQRAGGLKADPRVTTGDEGEGARQVAPPERLARRCLLAVPRTEGACLLRMRRTLIDACGLDDSLLRSGR